MRVRPLLAAPLLALLACGGADAPPAPVAPPPAPPPMAVAPQEPAASADQRYEKLWTEFLATYLRLEPVMATALGMHDHDGAWPDVSAAGEATQTAVYERTRDALRAIPVRELSPKNRLDAAILENALAQRKFEREQLHVAETDPLRYVALVGNGLDPLLTRDFAPPADRARSLVARLGSVGSVVAAARARLQRPPRIFTETAIKQNKGLTALVDGSFAEILAQAPDQRDAVLAAARRASVALHDLQTFLEGDLLARSDGDFRVGKDKLAELLRLHLDADVDADALVAQARAYLAKTQDEMVDVAKELWPVLMTKKPLPATATPAARTKLVREVLGRLAEDHPTNATVVADGSKLLAQATDFVRSHDLVGLPSEPCKVMEMPEYERGVAVAYCESSGPLEPKQETHITLSPTPADWPPARVASFFREYDESMLADLIVHEAMPGHYLQAMHANAYRGSPRTVFTNGSFEEGWAVYGEWLMARHGFGGARVRMQRLKMLTRVCVNAILDHEIHAGTMDEKAALDLMETEGFQEEGEATGKWTRARLSHGQLSTYFYGFSELIKLRQAAETRPGFSERAFNDELLSFGSPSMHQLRDSLAMPRR